MTIRKIDRLPNNPRSPLAVALAAGSVLSLVWASAAWGAELPLTDITLYRSGVGAFSHQGEVAGDDSVELTFGVDRINDILKSMVLLDYGGGEIGGVVYTPKRSLEDRLEDFTIDPRQASSLHGLLDALRGESVRLELTDGESVEGTVIGVESRIVTTAGAPEKAHESWATLITPSGVRTLPVNTLRSLRILNENLAGELERALAAIAEHRSDTRTTVGVNFRGEGVRSVSVVYTHSAPVWKVSYRLVLPESAGDEPFLQGWAIVENDTDADWEGVRLSLASGRPVSFVMDLQTPLNLRRPTVAVPVLSGIGPVVYESDIPESGLARAPSLTDTSTGASLTGGDTPGRSPSAFARESMDDSMPKSEFAGVPMQSAMGGGSATAGEAGEQFMYTIDAPVSVDRGESAMLPILGQPIDGRRMTIYSPSTGVSRPMRGVELTNDTGLHLPPGPISVYDGDAYAGDAQIRHTSRDQKRLLSYAADLDVDVTSERDAQRRVTRLRIVDGMIIETNDRTDRETYTVVNRDVKRARTVMIERPILRGWELHTPPKADERTENADRFLVELEPGATRELVVEHARTDSTRMAVLGYDLVRLLRYETDGAASKEVAEAIRQAAKLQNRVNAISAGIGELDRERNEITQDQDRVRRNMSSVQRGTDLHTRYIRKLSEQEDRLEAILELREESVKERDRAQRELDAFLRDLNLG